MSRYDIVQNYMMLGGIPYYLNYLQKGLSLAQNIDRLFFASNAKLQEEYDRLFSAVFSNPDEMLRELVSVIRGGSMNVSNNSKKSKILKMLMPENCLE